MEPLPLPEAPHTGLFPDPSFVICFPTVTMPDPLAHKTISLSPVSSSAFPAPLHGVAHFAGSWLPILLRKWQRWCVRVHPDLLGHQGLGGLMGEPMETLKPCPSGPEGSLGSPRKSGWGCAHRVPGQAQHLIGGWKTSCVHQAKKKEEHFLSLWDNYENSRQVILL